MSGNSDIQLVTGAFGYSGKQIARRLIEAGAVRVRTLTNSLHRPNPFADRVEVYPFNFDHPDKLIESLRGVSVLYNTYWVRFNHATFTHAQAVQNTLTLFGAAKSAGVRRIVHVSITNPSLQSELEYFRGKAILEEALKQLGISYAILRPAVLFGHDDILINNIAWMLRHLPVFGIFGNGQYRLQPIHVDDLADLAVQQGQLGDSIIINAIGPETFTYRGLVQQLGQIIGHERPIVSVSPWLGYAIGTAIGAMKGDVIVTRDEIRGLMDELLYADAPPEGNTKLTDWAKAHASELGLHYASELARRRGGA